MLTEIALPLLSVNAVPFISVKFIFIFIFTLSSPEDNNGANVLDTPLNMIDDAVDNCVTLNVEFKFAGTLAPDCAETTTCALLLLIGVFCNRLGSPNAVSDYWKDEIVLMILPTNVTLALSPVILFCMSV